MLVTKPLAELCALLIDELHGELPSRIFAMLLTKGRSTVPQLAQYTSMTPRQIRHGLAVLHQHNLLYYHVDASSDLAFYEANPENAYNLIRTGKILEMVETSFGAPAKDVVQSLLLSGQTRISDLVAAYKEKIDHATKEAAANGEEADWAAETNGINGDAPSTNKAGPVVKSTAHLNSILCRLVEAELIEVVHSTTFESPQDVQKIVEKEVMDKFFPAGVKGNKAKIEFQEKMAEGLRKVRAESKSLKRKLEQQGSGIKRRKLMENLAMAVTNGNHEEDLDPVLDPRQVIRINYEKCLVDLRNRRLVQFATDMYGETTAYVYGVLLKLLTKDLPRCRQDPLADVSEDKHDAEKPFLVTTDLILDNLKTSVDLSLGIGKAERRQVSRSVAERVEPYPPARRTFLDEAEVEGEASADEDEEDDESSEGSEEDEEDYKPVANGEANGVNGTNGARVKFAGAGGAAKEPRRLDRPTQLRQHLLLLCESTQHFVRHCGPDEWTVDFPALLRSLRETELDTVIERKCGRQGLRLARILRSKGKLEEKALPNVALMRKPELQQKMLEMQSAGFVWVQEVPRDLKADVKKSFFLWFCDVERSLGQMLANSYTTMVHCMQVLEALRYKERDVLETTKRTDVRGREKDAMRKEYYERYSRYLDCERKLFAQMMRLDDLVSVLRDF
ncbi:hypothetical protein VTJ83DRAFT_6266 [Remersonia thermophila]|uniref:DNA-directed RNA polymerase III subunit RPC3 n=1 Tax=Remersonia thermophila TaxID=72144 RepID=A0ABR4D478_9PEZI